MSKLGDQILDLRSRGLSYNQIVQELGCSKGTVCYHCDSSQKEKTRLRTETYRGQYHPYQRKLTRFQKRKFFNRLRPVSQRVWRKIMTDKICDFHKILLGDGKMKKEETKFTVEDVVSKFGDTPRCYLTGQEINMNDPSSFHFDHIQPRSKGGSNSLDNLGICTKEANIAKSDLTHSEFLALCRSVVNHNS